MRFSNRLTSPKSGDLSADAASRQRQILDRLSADYSRHVHELLRHRELIKGSVYQIQTRCGNPSCHCAKPRGVHFVTYCCDQSSRRNFQSLQEISLTWHSIND